MALVEAIEDADLPPGILNLVTGAGNVVGDEIVSNPGTDAVGFTGSAATGKIISQRAAGKPQLMELGGNGPVVILDDADLDRAAAATASGSFVNAGQVCSSSERILVHRKVYDAFAERMAAAARAVVLGDPREEGVTMGPLNNAGVARKVAEHVGDAVSRGATAITGGKRPEGALSPLYFEPTVLTGVTRDAIINSEETFGPVAPLLVFDSDEEAFEIARDNRYGLVSSVFTQDIDRAFRYVEEMPTGIVNINDTSNYWELHIPFGGVSRQGQRHWARRRQARADRHVRPQDRNLHGAMMRWEELTSPEIGALDRDGTVVILPLGSVEQHGNHMPLGTDTLLAQAVSLAAAEAAGDVNRHAAALVWILSPPHALPRLDNAARRNADGRGRGRRRLGGERTASAASSSSTGTAATTA